MKGDLSGFKIDAEVAESQQVHTNDGVSIPGELGIFRQAPDEDDHVGSVDWAELKIGQRGGFPLEFSIEVEALRGASVELELVGNFRVDDANCRARVQDELQVGLCSNAAFDLYEVAGSEFKR